MDLKNHLNAALVVCSSFLFGCEPIGSEASSGAFGVGTDVAQSSAAPSRLGPTRGQPNDVGALQRGSDIFLETNIPSSSQGQAIVVDADNERVELSLIEASVEAAAQAILGDALAQQYVIAESVTGRITIQTTGPIPKQALFDLFSAALSANDARIELEAGVYRILQGASGNRTFRVVGEGQLTSSSILVAPLKFVSAVEMIELLSPLEEDGLQLLGDRRRNLLLLSGPRPTLESALDALNLFDVDALRGKSIALVQLRSASPDAVVDELERIFEAGEGGALRDVVQFVPNDRLGSVLILSSRATYLDRARRWIRELDQTAAGSQAYLRNYPLQNRDAGEMAAIVSSLTDAGNASVPNSAETDGQFSVRNQIRVAADTSRNELIVRARRVDHEEIAAVIRSLDVPARQVLLEATIAEVALNDAVDVGVRWFFEAGNWQFRSSDLASGAVVGNSPGFSAVFGAGSSKVALSALSSVTDVKVISSPTLMVEDSKKGILQIGDEVPVATQTSSETSDDAAVLTQIEYRETGIILEVQPRISKSGQVRLDVIQEVSDVSTTSTSGIDSPTISTRRVETSVTLGDGQTLALGGLVQEDDNVTKTGVPGAQRIPVLGALFGSRSSEKRRTELLILIRPRVVYNRHSGDSATEYWRTKLTQADSILQTGLGGPTHSVRNFTQ